MFNCLIVVIFDVIFGYVIRGGHPYITVRRYITKNFIQVLYTMGLAYQERMEGNAHDPRALSALFIQLVELPLAYFREIISLVIDPKLG